MYVNPQTTVGLTSRTAGRKASGQAAGWLNLGRSTEHLPAQPAAGYLDRPEAKYGVSSHAGHMPELGKKQAKRAWPIPKRMWHTLKPSWHLPNPRLAHAKVGSGRDKSSLGQAQARVPPAPKPTHHLDPQPSLLTPLFL
ncbi:hypothetical protein PGT21_014142 [Puccinia graminis f. sp. tritici]|uniref:Uncharacterized protein n=1 Tax=Puccinia graminis f. sp. tritici TaxID=56615 RepID=A0A5B0SE57_PUCGR|nr:hypothetical protein PGT21_014142 [Puccinia graminis f. sp. tritici]KAA1136072.1 hypothetical protein PGTUg99_026328 [Puccinia graminis f. sp. tritici]